MESSLNFTGNAAMFSIPEEARKGILDLSLGSVAILWTCFINLFLFDIISV